MAFTQEDIDRIKGQLGRIPLTVIDGEILLEYLEEVEMVLNVGDGRKIFGDKSWKEIIGL